MSGDSTPRPGQGPWFSPDVDSSFFTALSSVLRQEQEPMTEVVTLANSLASPTPQQSAAHQHGINITWPRLGAQLQARNGAGGRIPGLTLQLPGAARDPMDGLAAGLLSSFRRTNIPASVSTSVSNWRSSIAVPSALGMLYQGTAATGDQLQQALPRAPSSAPVSGSSVASSLRRFVASCDLPSSGTSLQPLQEQHSQQLGSPTSASPHLMALDSTSCSTLYASRDGAETINMASPTFPDLTHASLHLNGGKRKQVERGLYNSADGVCPRAADVLRRPSSPGSSASAGPSSLAGSLHTQPFAQKGTDQLGMTLPSAAVAGDAMLWERDRVPKEAVSTRNDGVVSKPKRTGVRNRVLMQEDTLGRVQEQLNSLTLESRHLNMKLGMMEYMTNIQQQLLLALSRPLLLLAPASVSGINFTFPAMNASLQMQQRQPQGLPAMAMAQQLQPQGQHGLMPMSILANDTINDDSMMGGSSSGGRGLTRQLSNMSTTAAQCAGDLLPGAMQLPPALQTMQALDSEPQGLPPPSVQDLVQAGVTPELLQWAAGSTLDMVRTAWKEFLAEASMLLLASEQQARGPAAAEMALQSLATLVQRALLKLLLVAFLRPTVLAKFRSINLESGATSCGSDAHWQQVARSLRLQGQEREALGLLFQVCGRLQDQLVEEVRGASSAIAQAPRPTYVTSTCQHAAELSGLDLLSKLSRGMQKLELTWLVAAILASKNVLSPKNFARMAVQAYPYFVDLPCLLKAVLIPQPGTANGK